MTTASRTYAEQEFSKRASSIRQWSLDCRGVISTPAGDATVASVGSPTVSPTTAPPLVIAGAEPSDAITKDKDGRDIPIAEAIVFTASGGTAGSRYKVTLPFELSNGEDDEAAFYVNVEA